jgi:glycosyltransferase involved in cell wall biosynthesis
LAVAKRRFDLFVAATPEIARKFPAARTIEVKNYPRAEMFRVADPQSRSFRSRDLVFAGLLSETRGAVEMLDAMAAMPSLTDIRLKLFGQISPAALETRMRAHPAWSKVDYVGHRPWRDVLDAYNQSLAGLLLYEATPEQRHAMPVKLFEFLLAGLPVIASDMPFWRQLLDGNPAVIFVDLDKPAAIAAAVAQLAADPRAAHALGLAGAAHARARFDWSAEGQRLVAAYDMLAARLISHA